MSSHTLTGSFEAFNVPSVMKLLEILGRRDLNVASRCRRAGTGILLALSFAPAACGSSTASSATPGGGSSGGQSSAAVASSSTGAADSSAAGSSTGDVTSASSTSEGAGNSSESGSGASTSSGMSGEGSGSTQSSAATSSSGSTGDGDGGSNGGSSHADASTGGDGGKPDQSTLPAVTIHMAGDSTMSNYTAATTQEGWGQELGQYFIAQVTIDNQAQPGANIQTFYAGKWKTLIANVKAGDYVMAAFGINDSGTTHGPVSVPDFTTELGVMAGEVAAKNATFIPTTSSPLQVWVNGMETNTRLQPYVDATIAFGMTKGLLVDNLNAAGVAYYNTIGQTAAAALTFNGDKAHFDKAGATEMALLASQQLATIGSPLAAYLK